MGQIVASSTDRNSKESTRSNASRPFEVSVLAAFLGLTSAGLIVVGGISLPSRSGTFLISGLAVVLVFGTLYAACAVGLWHLRNWARWLTIVLALLLASKWYQRVPILVLAIIITVYLLLPITRRVFIHKKPTFPIEPAT